MKIIKNTVDAASEKHLPVVSVADGKVEVSVGDISQLLFMLIVIYMVYGKLK